MTTYLICISSAVGLLILYLWANEVVSTSALIVFLALSVLILLSNINLFAKIRQGQSESESASESFKEGEETTSILMEEYQKLLKQDGSSFSLAESVYQNFRTQILAAQIQLFSMAIFQKLRSSDDDFMLSVKQITVTHDFLISNSEEAIWDALELYGRISGPWFSQQAEDLVEFSKLDYDHVPSWDEMLEDRRSGLLAEEPGLSEEEVERSVNFASLDYSDDDDYMIGGFVAVGIKVETAKAFPQMALPEENTIPGALANYYHDTVEKLYSIDITEENL